MLRSRSEPLPPLLRVLLLLGPAINCPAYHIPSNNLLSQLFLLNYTPSESLIWAGGPPCLDKKDNQSPTHVINQPPTHG